MQDETCRHQSNATIPRDYLVNNTGLLIESISGATTALASTAFAPIAIPTAIATTTTTTATAPTSPASD